MDDVRFDRLARALGGAATRRGALAALLGAGLAAAPAAEAKKKRNRCNPACGAGQTCVKGACTCENGGTPCGASCCPVGAVCRDGQCGTPEPPACIPFGEACKGAGRSCCAGAVCASGQGGKTDVACYAPAGAACQTTADCVHLAECVGGICEHRQPQPTPPAARCTVCASGCPHTTIEAAIAAARNGDVITIDAGTYTTEPANSNDDWGDHGDEPVYYYYRIDKPLTLKACETGAEVTISCPTVDVANWYACILGDAGATIEGLTVVGNLGEGNYTLGFATPSTCSGGLTIRNCNIETAFHGVLNRCARTVSIEGEMVMSDMNVNKEALYDEGGGITCAVEVDFGNPPPENPCYPASINTTIVGCGCPE